MIKMLFKLSVVLLVSFAGTAFAQPPIKVDICHNGSVYVGDTEDGAIYDPNAWEPGSFVINVSERAVTKHTVNHGDLTEFSSDGEVITEVVVGEGGYITGFETKPSCGENSYIEVDPY